jgi:hypothetical protein
MKKLRNIARSATILSVFLLLSGTVTSQDLPAVTGGEGSPLSMLDDLTSSLLADEQVLSNGTDVTPSLLEDLNNTDALSDVIATESPDNPSTQDPAVPVDGGLSLLLAAGAADGAGKLRRRSPFK